MHLLLIHQNFPGQFRELGPAWLAAGHRLTAIGSRPERPSGEQWRGLDYWNYQIQAADQDSEPGMAQRGEAVGHLCHHLRNQGLRPDVVLAHSAWGEALRLRTVFPHTPLVIYPELWGTPEALGVNFDAALIASPDGTSDALIDPARLSPHLERQNLLADLAISQADAVVVPSQSQIDSFPEPLRPRLQLIPEGVNLQRVQPNPQAQLALPGLPPLRYGDPIVTLVSRELEPLRGLRTALRAWPAISAACPDARLVLVGDKDGGYGREQPSRGSHLEDALAELPADLDRSRIHCPGRLAYADLLQLLQCSACHLALSYPYTLSWSTLEAMACGAPMITNPGSPLSGELLHGETGLLVGFSAAAELSQAVIQILQNEQTRNSLARAGRALIEQRFSLSQALERYAELFRQLSGSAPHPTH